MSQSQDIIISDNDTNVLKTNQSDINFDDIVSKSNDMVAKNEPQVNKKDIHLSKKEQKLAQMIQNEEEEPERQNLIYIIQKYQSSERFGNYVRSELKITYTNETLSKKSVSQLQTILNKIRLHLDNKNLSKVYDSVLFSTTTMIEMMSKPVANVDGFNNLLMENDEFLNCWERYKCESIMPTIPSHLQMLFILGQTYLLAYSMNKMKEPSEDTLKIIADIEKEIEEDTQKRNDDKKDEKKDDNDEVLDKPNFQTGMDI